MQQPTVVLKRSITLISVVLISKNTERVFQRVLGGETALKTAVTINTVPGRGQFTDQKYRKSSAIFPRAELIVVQ